jgi:hypothetical protein
MQTKSVATVLLLTIATIGIIGIQSTQAALKSVTVHSDFKESPANASLIKH